MSNLRDAAGPDGSERFREEYRIVNVNACGVGSCDPAQSRIHIPPGAEAMRFETWQAYAVKAVFWPINNAGDARRRLWRLLRLQPSGRRHEHFVVLMLKT
jgi:hypothetical protein